MNIDGTAIASILSEYGAKMEIRYSGRRMIWVAEIHHSYEQYFHVTEETLEQLIYSIILACEKRLESEVDK